MAVTFSIETSTLAAGAIGIIRLAGDDLDATLERLALPPVAPGAVVLADLLGVDRGLVARYSAAAADLMVHGGRGVVAAMAEALTTQGIKEGASGTPVPLTGPPVSAPGAAETPSSPPPRLPSPPPFPTGEVAGVLDSRRGSPGQPLAPVSTPAPERRPPPTSKTRPPPPLETGEGKMGPPLASGTRTGRLEAAPPCSTSAGEGSASAWPEAADPVEAAMLEALAHAASPRAIPVLLAQPPRHRSAPAGPYADGSALAHLLTPPLVVITGPPNIGKSSLLNALASRVAAIVADQAGTTRDAVAAHAVVDGLTIRLVDTPGMVDRAAGCLPGAAGSRPPLSEGCTPLSEGCTPLGEGHSPLGEGHPPLGEDLSPLGEGLPTEPDPLIRAATTIARTLIAAADLILVCSDAGAGEATEPIPHTTKGGPLPAALTPESTKGGRLPAALAVATRCDLSPAPINSALAVSATTGEGLDALAVAIRTALIPDSVLADERPWSFVAAAE